MAGFNPIHLQIAAPEQTVAVHLTNIVKGKLFFLVQGVLFRHIPNQRLPNQRHVPRGAVLSVGIQTMHRHKVGVFQAKRFHIVIHQTDKGILTAGNIVCQRDAGIVPGLDHNPFVQLMHRDTIAGLQKHQRRAPQFRIAGSPGILPHCYHVVRFNFAGFDCLANHIAGHHFCQAGGIESLIGIGFGQHFAAGVVN